MPTLWISFISTSSPLLPGATLARWALPVFWAVVLAFAGLYVTKRLLRPRGKLTAEALAFVVAAWAFAPGPWSPTYWLGLAFQLPSLMSVGLCGLLLAGYLRQAAQPPVSRPISSVHGLGILLGWLLLLDTLLILPFSLYRWGYSPAALAVLSALAVALWVWRAKGVSRGAALLLVVLALFVVSRLPSGNVFDAVIDPWLWLALQFKAFKNWRAGQKS